MSTQKIWNEGCVIWQTADSELEIAEAALLVHVDNSPVICIAQNGQEIVLNFSSLPELIAALKKLISDRKKKQVADAPVRSNE